LRIVVNTAVDGASFQDEYVSPRDFDSFSTDDSQTASDTGVTVQDITQVFCREGYGILV